ncbi:MAG TPA: dihydrodipicolinate synthase family protein [Thermoplasmata archaeon]|nr:dihydrodipicolinate synthase family protein [Thermoplasmata archaeon]
MALDGLSVPIPTLFADDGAVDLGRNSRFARTLSDAKVDHLFALGTLGEFPLVTDDERTKLVDLWVQSVSGKTDVWVGCGAPATARAVAYATEAESAGAEAIVAVGPYYLKPTVAALGGYFRAIHEAITVPLLAYNIPAFVGYALPPDLVHALARDGVLAGIKDTSGSLESVRSFLAGAPDGFAVFPGDDALAAAAIAAGAAGAVMGMANLVPALCVGLVAAARAHEAGRATELQGLVDQLVEVTRAGPFPSVDKFLAHRLRGADVGYRAPFGPLAPEEEAAVLARLAPIEARLKPFLGK